MTSPAPTESSDQKRVLRLQLANGFSPEARADSVLLRHMRSPWDAMVICHELEQDNLAAQLAEASARPVHAVDSGWRESSGTPRSLPKKIGSAIRLARAFPPILRMARSWNPDIVSSSQQRWDCFLATFVAWFLRRPQVIHLHYNTEFIGAWARWRLRRCAHVITVSDFIRDQVLALGVPPERVTTILNTMEPIERDPRPGECSIRTELSLPDDALVLTIAGRLVPWKGQRDTLEAFSRIASRHPRWHLLIAGDGPDEPVLRQRIHHLGLEGRVHLLGFRDDVLDIVAESDVVAHPSRHDPCPLSLLEGLASGKPCVAYAEGGALQLVAHGETGWLVPPEDIAELATRFDQLFADRNLRERMGRAAVERIRREFRPVDAGAAYTRVLEEIVAAPTAAQSAETAPPARPTRPGSRREST